MLVAWVLFPLLLAALCAGCGLLADRLVGSRLPGALVPPVGLAVVIAVGQFLTLADFTAEFTTPVVGLIAASGVIVGRRRISWPNVGWPAAAATAVFAAYAAPIVLSGEATFAGYVKLDDTATWMAFTDRIMDHGRSLEGLAPSTYEAVLSLNIGEGYPVGVFIPLGVGAALVGEDLAWLIQSYMAFAAALLALALWELGRGLVTSVPLRAGVAFAAAQPALLFGYHLWGGIKEVVAAGLVATAAALVPLAASASRRLAVLPLALVAAALAGTLGGAAVIWLAVPLGVALTLAVQGLGGRDAAARAALFAVAAAVLTLPVWAVGGIVPPTASPLTDPDALGNLIRPLDPLQLAGIWPAEDFRLEPDAPLLTYTLIALAATVAVLGTAAAWWRRDFGPLALVGASIIGAILIGVIGSPWAEGKAFAIGAVAIPFAALGGAAAIWAAGHRPIAVAVAVCVAAGVLGSNLLAHRDVSLAPRDRLAELEEIGKQVAGQGPTLMTEYNPYGVRHFLREADPEGVSELRRRRIPLRDGGTVPKGEAADIAELSPHAVLVYRTLVLRRGADQGRPPAAYARTFVGEHYEVWQRPRELVTR